ncbi:MAG TPA: TIGR03759 family integrating conjugative element protein, partial [Gammaproteobacteria bacterium]|nr:TIGR03759 family integrating conjugative element protein [Gammaproteobacteria bacterium]
EWNQYKRWMQGTDGLWYAHMTPPAVLGMRADSPEAQRHFAEIVARQEHDKVERELAFNNAVFIAMRRLYPDEPIIKDFDKSAFNPVSANSKSKNAILQPGDRLALFENIQQGLDLAILPKVLGLLRANNKVSLDIYCRGNLDDNAIRHWAALNNIPANLVGSGRITLNQDDGRLKNNTVDLKPPYLLLVRDGQSQVVSVWDL